MKILIADKFEQAGIDGLKALGAEVAYEPTAGAEGLGAALTKVKPDVLVVRSSKVAAPVIQETSGLKGIIRAGAGVDNIDVAAATAKGIGVCNCPGMNAIAVAELTMGLLLSCDRRLVDQTAEIRAGKWNKKEYGKARGLKGSMLGVVGLGAIGKAVIQRAKAFEMGIIAWSRSLTAEQARQMGVHFGGNDRASLLKMLKDCDSVSVHVALAEDTKRLCNAEFFAAMKPGAYFINTSRGGVVDEAAVREAVKSKKLRVGLDVYENQPAATEAGFASETVGLSGSTFTHHCGASTDQSQAAVAEEVVRIAKVFRDTGRLENRVN
jgi:D-3-phosphoglycerate dehydrogenase / 2-oxoglutarate reductase